MIEEYTVWVFIRALRNANPLNKNVIDWTGKCAHMQLEPEVRDWYANNAANDRRF